MQRLIDTCHEDLQIEDRMDARLVGFVDFARPTIERALLKTKEVPGLLPVQSTVHAILYCTGTVPGSCDDSFGRMSDK